MRAANPMKVIIYTDGACKNNPGPGGWGVLLRWGDKKKELFGDESQTTNNRMEMTAAIRALESLTRSCDVVLHTDSKYVQLGITEWMPKWRRQDGGLSRRRGVIKNQDLWEQLTAAAARHKVEWRWVKGHADDEGNICADKLANCGVQQAIKKLEQLET